VAPSSSKRTVYVRDDALWQRLSDYAEQTGQSVSTIVAAAVRHYLTVLAEHPDPAMRPRG
jgi:predicted transcriptional regulator